jgi:hypothetical protein
MEALITEEVKKQEKLQEVEDTYQLSMADLQWSKLSIERLSGLNIGTFGIEGCRI